MKITVKIESYKVKNHFYSLVMDDENAMMIVNEDDLGIAISKGDLYKIIDDFFKKRTT